MANEKSPQEEPNRESESLSERVARLEDRVAHLEKGMESIGKMESALSHLFRTEESGDS